MQKLWNHRTGPKLWGAWLCALLAVVLLGSGCSDGPAPSDNKGAGAQAGNLICQPGLTSCNGECVDVKAASSNCGSCGVACTAPAVCANGACTTSCAAGFQKCGDSCVNQATDAAHCGSCDKVCEAGVPCYGGVCGCPESALFCQGQCFDPMSTAAHCGTCETACNGGAACVDGKCQCAVGEQLCGNECSNLNSPQHCGSCAKACNSGEICAVTLCIPSTQACPGSLVRCGDACVDLQTTAANCGVCDNKCAGGQACIAGTCGCPSGKTACGSSCVDLSSSALNCGTCGKVCTAGQTCQAGGCKCGDATDILCDNACTDAKTDVNHCGDCATKCTGGLPCTDGKCACPAGEVVCAGKCVSTDSTPENCGGCGMACPMGESCQAGKCSGAFGDSCTSTPAVGINIDDISVYQAGKIQIMKADQPVAKADRPADVIQGKPGRVRVFTTLGTGWANRTVSARLTLSNGDVMTKYVAKRNVTMASAENSFATTFNFDVKGEDFTATTRYAVEIVECDGTPAGTLGKPRFPATGDQELVTRKTGVVKVHFVPLQANGKTAAVDSARLDAYKNYVALMYPASAVEYTVADPPLKLGFTVSSQGDGWSEALDQIASQHEADDAPADTYYYGLFQPTDNLGQYCGNGCVAGIGFVTDTSNFSRHNRAALGLSYADIASAQTMAHEVGHNHGREHAPCGGAAGPDQNFPYAGAKIGWWGFEGPDKLHNPMTDTDIMGYCKNQWASDYTYRALADRIARINGNTFELPPAGGMHHYLFLLTDVKGPRWGAPRPAPRYPSGSPELADVLDAEGQLIASVTVYRTPMDHLGGAQLLVPDPEPGWHAIQIHGAAPLAFGSTTSSR
jgi:stigma-specific protein Stig1